MREAAVACMIPIYNWFSLVRGDEDPLSNIKFLPCKLWRVLENVGVGDVPLDDLVLILLPIFELAPHVVGVYAELSSSFCQGDACPSGAGNGLDDPEGSGALVVGFVELGEQFMVMQDEDEKSIVDFSEGQGEVFHLIPLQIEEGFLNQSIVKFLLGSEVDMLVRLKSLEVGRISLMSADFFQIHAQFDQYSCLLFSHLEDGGLQDLPEMHLHQLHSIFIQKPNDILGYDLQHDLDSDPIIFLSKLLILIGDEIGPGVVWFPIEDLMQFVFIGEVEGAIEVVVEFSTFQGVVVAGLIDVGPEQVGFVFSCFCVGLPTDACQIGFDVLLHVVFIIQETDAFWLGFLSRGLLLGPCELDCSVQPLDLTAETVSLLLQARLDDFSHGGKGFDPFGYFFQLLLYRFYLWFLGMLTMLFMLLFYSLQMEGLRLFPRLYRFLFRGGFDFLFCWIEWWKFYIAPGKRREVGGYF